jgi:tRNA dimethylallyltransferase
MIEKGLVDEVSGLREKGYSPILNSLNTVGYKEVFDFLEGKLTREDMIELIKRNTRRFAKRQLTWFRADKRIHWIKVNEVTNWEEVVKRIYEEFKACLRIS